MTHSFEQEKVPLILEKEQLLKEESIIEKDLSKLSIPLDILRRRQLLMKEISDIHKKLESEKSAQNWLLENSLIEKKRLSDLREKLEKVKLASKSKIKRFFTGPRDDEIRSLEFSIAQSSQTASHFYQKITDTKARIETITELKEGKLKAVANLNSKIRELEVRDEEVYQTRNTLETKLKRIRAELDNVEVKLNHIEKLAAVRRRNIVLALAEVYLLMGWVHFAFWSPFPSMLADCRDWIGGVFRHRSRPRIFFEPLFDRGRIGRFGLVAGFFLLWGIVIASLAILAALGSALKNSSKSFNRDRENW